MNLKDFLANRDSPPELLWSLVVEEGWAQAGIWYIDKEKADVVSISTPAPWETEEELIGAVDTALSSAIQKLPENSKEPEKTVFGVPSSWVEQGEISEVYLEKIKKICTDMSLTPVGFVVLSEAIAHLKKSEEGSPLNSIVVGLGKENLELSIFNLGNLIGSTKVARSVSVSEDVAEGLSRFEGASPLPSRIIVYDGKEGDLEEAKQNLMQASWDGNEKIKFLHTPKVEALQTDQKVLATALAGAAEIGNVSVIISKEETIEGPGETDPILETESNVAQTDVSPEDLGFSVGEDISEKTPQLEEKSETPKAAPPVQDSEPRMQMSSAHVVNQSQMPESAMGEVNLQPHLKNNIKVKEYIDKTKGIFHNFTSKMNFKKPKFKTEGRRPIAMLLMFLFVLIFGGLGYWWFYPKAEITIYVTPKSFQKEAEITFNTEGTSDESEGVIPADVLSKKIESEKTKATSGTKVIGDRATGSVKVQNGTAFPINITEGTFLTSSGNLKFSANESASVSAALSPSAPGTATINVTADAIGAEYNLAKDEIFRVGNYPKAEVDATSVSDFSGGSSREISAVSKDDQTSLSEELTQELSEKVVDELRGEARDEQIFIEKLASVEVDTQDFDHKLGEEADTLKLSLAITANAVAADKEKLLNYAKSLLKDNIPSGFVLRDTQIKFEFEYIEDDGIDFKYKVNVSANFLPETNTDSLIDKISGKTTTVTENYLSTVPGFTRAEVTLRPKLPGIFGNLPRVKKNISVEVVAEK